MLRVANWNFFVYYFWFFISLFWFGSLFHRKRIKARIYIYLKNVIVMGGMTDSKGKEEEGSGRGSWRGNWKMGGEED